MVLGFDIGNTRINWALYDNHSVVPLKHASSETKRISTPDDIADMLKDGLQPDKIDGISISSVVPELNPLFMDFGSSRLYVPVHVISHTSRLSIRLNYTDPAELGVDRITNAEAAFREYGGGAIIIDLGTAITYCVILEDGTFDGGLIGPGIGLSIKSLASNTSQLPEVDFEKPPRITALDTVNAVKSGFYYGWISMITGIISYIEEYYGKSFQVILTGGYSSVIQEHLPRQCVTDILLTLKGIKYIFDIN